MDYLCIGVVVLAFLGGIIAAINENLNKTKRLPAALEAYRASLEQLKADPNNPELRQDTLRLGRIYSNLTRDQKGVTVYDEIALKNDIDAACAGAVSIQNSSIEDRLTRLQKLWSAGHITDNCGTNASVS